MKLHNKLAIGLCAFFVFFNVNLFSQRIDPDGLWAIPKNQRAKLIKQFNLYISLVKKNDGSHLCRMYDEETRARRCADKKNQNGYSGDSRKIKSATTAPKYKELIPHWWFSLDSKSANRYDTSVDVEQYYTDETGAEKIIKDVGSLTITFKRGNWYFSPILIFRVLL
jgi:hypothetical protein